MRAGAIDDYESNWMAEGGGSNLLIRRETSHEQIQFKHGDCADRCGIPVIATIVPKLTRLATGQRRLWPELRPGVELRLVLYGGTAISLHLGHRASIDFDFFCTRPLDKNAIRRAFPFMQGATVLRDADDTLVVLVPVRGKNPVKVAFHGGQTYGRIGDPQLTRDGVLEVASLDDLMAHKLRAILARQKKKDYEDIAGMIRAGCPVSRGLAGARALFGKAFQPAAALKALVYFEGGDLAALSAADRSTLIAAARTVGVLPTVKLRSSHTASPRGQIVREILLTTLRMMYVTMNVMKMMKKKCRSA